ncbi:MAG: serine hydrolase [Proteobacteria bacterium]|nr:serine hydrolase [Pseudomonadota bacterium]
MRLRPGILIVSILGLSALASACQTHGVLTSSEIDAVTAKAMQHFSVPGVAIGVIKDGTIVHTSGYGVLEIGMPEAIDDKTLFKIASNTKAMTTAALAMLVDEGQARLGR